MSEQKSPQPAASGLLEKIVGKTKKVVGRVVGNDDLAEEGELQHAKAETAEDAARLVAEAEQRDREADLAAEQTANRIEQERVEAELSRIEREDEIEREHDAEKMKIDQQSAHARDVAVDQARSVDQMIRKQEHDVDAARLDGVVEAATIAQRAKLASSAADALDAAKKDLEHHPNGESS